MAGEDAGELAPLERRCTRGLLIKEAQRRGWGLEVWGDLEEPVAFFPPDGPECQWPPVIHVRKSQVPALLADATALRSVPTLPPSRANELPLPLCVKPDEGSMGVGFQRIDDADALSSVLELPDDAWVTQPFLDGLEYRVSLCRSGVFAAAQLLERKGELSRWRDVTEQLPGPWLPDLGKILERLALAVIGVDILLTNDERAHVLDINTAPDIAIHLVTQTPRDLTAAVLDCSAELTLAQALARRS